MNSMDEKLREYARLLIEVGLHVKKGQTLVISSPVECAFFARMCASAAYNVGCREVVMNWHDDYLAREKFLRAEDAEMAGVGIAAGADDVAAGHELGVHACRHQDGHAAGDVAPAAAAHVRAVEED